MSVSPGRVHDQDTRISADGFGESLGTLLENDLAPALFAREGGIKGRSLGIFAVDEFGDDNFFLESRFAL